MFKKKIVFLAGATAAPAPPPSAMYGPAVLTNKILEYRQGIINEQITFDRLRLFLLLNCFYPAMQVP